MLTRRAKRVAVRPELAHGALLPLPYSLVLAILLCLPPDERLLAALVSRAFRAAVADPSLWRVVSLAPGSGVAEDRVGDALLRAISLKAAGSTVELDGDEQVDVNEWPVSTAALLEVVTANGRSLRRLTLLSRPNTCATQMFIVDLLRAAPHVVVLEADVGCVAGEAHALLTGEAPSGPLRLRRLDMGAPWHGEGVASVLAVAAAVAAHPSLDYLRLFDAPLNSLPALTAVVDAALRLASVALWHCSLSPASAPQLTRLLRGGCLRRLSVSNDSVAMLDEASAPGFCAAVRAAPLKSLTLNGMQLWASFAVGDAVVAAIFGHRTITEVDLSANTAEDEAAVGRSLAGLLVANNGESLLTKIRFAGCELGDAGLRPVLAALRRCTHLHALEIDGNGATQAFARDELLPAVEANASLRKLKADYDPTLDDVEPSVPELARAKALVAARPA